MDLGSNTDGVHNNVCYAVIPTGAIVYAVHNISTSEAWGIVEIGKGRLYQGSWKENRFNGVIVAVDINTKQMLAVYRINGDQTETILDVSEIVSGVCTVDSYLIWEGAMFKGIPCGYGRILSPQKDLLYEGFRFNINNICYGKKYQSGILVYEGMICNDKRHGISVMSKEHINHWINDNWVTVKECHLFSRGPEEISSFIEELIITDRCCSNVSSFSIRFYPYLSRILIGNHCFSKYQPGHFCLSSLPSLKSVIIQSDSFTTVDSISVESRVYCYLYQLDLPKLTHFQIHCSCFQKARFFSFFSVLS